jgi:hypothetical protein
MSETFSAADREYIRRNFSTLAAVCERHGDIVEDVKKLMSAGRLPGPSYIVDGVDFVPDDYFNLIDEAGSVAGLKDYFLARYDAAGGAASEREESWDEYLSGINGVCLRRVSPETIARKNEVVTQIEELLAAPEEEDERWRQRLREGVNELDELEGEFAPDYDRSARFPKPPTRDRLINAVRVRYPEVFAPADVFGG